MVHMAPMGPGAGQSPDKSLLVFIHHLIYERLMVSNKKIHRDFEKKARTTDSNVMNSLMGGGPVLGPL